jgi:hypothetical protein
LRNQQPCAPGFTPATQPGCVVPRSTSSTGVAGGWRSYSTADGTTVSRNASQPGPVTVPRSITTGQGGVPSVQSSTVTRGGFGSTARSTSSSSSS